MCSSDLRHLAAFSPLHRLEVLEGAGHLPMRQMPARLAVLLRGWLQEEGLLHQDAAMGSAGNNPVASAASGQLPHVA